MSNDPTAYNYNINVRGSNVADDNTRMLHVAEALEREWSKQLPAMTLRDWFAGQALAGLVARASTFNSAAEWAYAYADAMLKAREAKK